MKSDDNTVARAIELARNGPCRNLTELRRTLQREGYGAVGAHLDGPTFRRQLIALIKVRLGSEDSGRVRN